MAQVVVEMSGDEARLFRSLDKVIQKEAEHERQLRDTANAGAKAGDDIDKGMGKAGNASDKAAKKGKKSWRDFGTSAVVQVGGIVTAFASVGKGVQLVNEFLEHQNELYTKALDTQKELAASQQEAFKNLAGLEGADRLGLIDAAPDIARETGFSDIGAIIGATGAAVSAGADRPAAESAVTAAALLTVHTPEALEKLTAAAIDLKVATGTSDAEENLGFLTLAGTQSRVVDPLALAETLAPALVSAVGTVPNQDKAEASRQSAALFAALSKITADSSGKSTSTASTQFTAELGKFFSELETQRIDARSKVGLIDKKIAKGSDTEANRAERDRLKAFLDDAKGFQDPETIFGRIEALQSNSGIKDQFFNRDFGEVKFKGAFKQVADSSSDLAKGMKESFEIIQISKAAFASVVEDSSGATAGLRVAGLESRFEASGNASRSEDTLGAMRALVRTNLNELLEDTAQPGIGGFLNSLTSGTTFGNLSGTSVAAESFSAIEQTIQRQQLIASGGITSEEQPDFQQVTGGIATFRDALLEAVRQDPESVGELEDRLDSARIGTSLNVDSETLSADGKTSQNVVDFLEQLVADAREAASQGRAEQQERMAVAAERSATANEATAANTSSGEPEPINYGNIQRGREQ